MHGVARAFPIDRTTYPTLLRHAMDAWRECSCQHVLPAHESPSAAAVHAACSCVRVTRLLLRHLYHAAIFGSSLCISIRCVQCCKVIRDGVSEATLVSVQLFQRNPVRTRRCPVHSLQRHDVASGRSQGMFLPLKTVQEGIASGPRPSRFHGLQLSRTSSSNVAQADVLGGVPFCG